MADRNIGPERVPEGTPRPEFTGGTEPAQPSVMDLVRRLGRDTAELVRQEVNLARLEMKETAQEVTANLVKIGAAFAIAAAGGLALTAFLVIVIGNALGGAYWAGALIVGVAFLLIGGLLVNHARRNLKAEELKPERTIESVRENREFARHEAEEFRRDIRH